MRGLLASAALLAAGCTLSVPDVVSSDGGVGRGEAGMRDGGAHSDGGKRDGGGHDSGGKGDGGHKGDGGGSPGDASDTGAPKDTGPPCTTTVSGTVFDPAGALPLPNVAVFQPKGALTKFVDGVTCDTCASLASPSFASVPSGTDGTFMLPIDVTGGTANVHVVFQSGRWRREILLPPVTACMDNPIATGNARLPKDRSEGDIPKTAIAMTSLESLECLLVKAGISASEIQPYQTPTDLARFQTFINGTGALVTTPASPPMLPTLFDTALGEYTSVLFPCDGTATLATMTPTEQAGFVTWADNGGRGFIDHYMGVPLIHTQLATTSWPATATGPWGGSAYPVAPAQGKLLMGSPGPTGLEAWMALKAVNGTATYGAPYFSVGVPRAEVTTVNAATATEWARGLSTNLWSSNPAGDYTITYSFDTPLSAKKSCGRVIYNDMHVSATRGTAGGPFPTACDTATALGEDEKALEYMLFVSTACFP